MENIQQSSLTVGHQPRGYTVHPEVLYQYRNEGTGKPYIVKRAAAGERGSNGNK